MNSFGEELKRLRKERGLSQKELADSAELGDVQISTYENGRVVPTKKSLRALARALNLPEGYFNDFMPEESEEIVSHDVMIRELLDFLNLRPSYRHSKMILDMMRTISETYQKREPVS
ncbi:MAG TPA: helix-turn-helix transcriptional regulator [Cyclobacteriaceae bacterium]|nr:helix-turn-helix domain-containing protein [Cyclobacteriaceae bacterium]HMV09305.1 helix-turn-helix transcriptional regulator [Cyclobacteriaceae bacterium]HMX01894.1 helix-turn-helix transcriptional regulator [Cyclobacteriaceae bacterium]HMX50818.1 helix-turn-helix transcriptional regulator [Cyclobacteriaceae bacterium]HMY94718.1 helix-turn-helix transcriptional regulator [Cyclobacteriaceae bacterium]